jgi:hypothetical protein
VANSEGPFSLFGGGNLGLQSMDMPSSTIDWVSITLDHHDSVQSY